MSMLKKTCIKVLCIVMCMMNIISLSGCGSYGSFTTIELNEPSYQGPAENAKPRYKFTWSRILNADKYEVMIHTSLDGYEGNFSRFVYDGVNYVSLVFLQGVYTNTVNYRVKVRGYDSDGKRTDWSNVWELDFSDGVCTMKNNAPDFPEEIEEQSSLQIVEPTAAPAANHMLPESLVTFMSKEAGRDDLDLNSCTAALINVRRCEYSEPYQLVYESELVKKLIDVISKIEVTEVYDNMESTSDSVAMKFFIDGESVADAEFQDGLLIGKGTRYVIKNYDELEKLDFLMMPDDWDSYWDRERENSEAYLKEYSVSPQDNVLSKASYISNVLYNNINSADVFMIQPSMTNQISIQNEFIVDDKKIDNIMNGISSLKIVKQFEGDESLCQEWNLRILFTLDDGYYQPEVVLNFKGDNIILPDGKLYEVSGLDELLKVIDTPTAEYLLNNRNHRPVKPVF